MTTTPERGTRNQLALPTFSLESGAVLTDAQISYRTYGSLSAAGDNAVLLFTYYTGDDRSYQPWIGPGRPLDPGEHFVVVVDHFGGGVSTSPSTLADTSGTAFPEVRVGDSVAAAELVLDSLGVQHLRLVAGWSLGGMQSLEFAARYPDRVSAVYALCSAARCSPVNQVFLDSVSAALTAGAGGADGQAARERLDAFGRVYAGWAYCEQFFADEVYRQLGYSSPADVVARWGEDHQSMHAGDLLASLTMWRAADGGLDEVGERLNRITARTVLMPSVTDTYFTVAENTLEAAWLPDGEMRPLVSPLGHIAGRPGIRTEEQDEVDACLRELVKTS
ncbi:alpha/beta fold hydrolase [Mycobacterium sp. ITM-2016-00317]|uniref:alpha/beta fold hydrolase n=1 Tax=Mycobacterium sp. ITM-2016-00317 TaxID=2099694 RepID=UPI00287F5150|nr:alpha/beta fold hydrolase [Mycobacterium sp. ITM-2016-00317]WNG87783.1 alpha/beta fold hydrolase [Mycobacterium sp. ITM-2016-00317]